MEGEQEGVIQDTTQIEVAEIALICAVDSIQEALKQANDEIYDKYIEAMAKPYSAESIGLDCYEVAHLGNIIYDKNMLVLNSYEYESLEEAVRPKIDRWATRNCPVKKVDKIEFSDLDIQELNMFGVETISETTQGPEKFTISFGGSILSRRSSQQSIISRSSIKLKSRKHTKKRQSMENSLEPESPKPEDLDPKEEPKHVQIPLNDLPSPREIPLEEKLLRDRKNKQEANKQKKEKELTERVQREEELREALMKSEYKADIKNKKITYDHHGKVLMIKTLSEKKLPPKVEPGIIIDRQQESEKKKKIKLKPKPIDSSLILKRTGHDDIKFMTTLNDCLQDPTGIISLEPGVNLETNGRFMPGPDLENSKMTLEQYYIYCQNNENDRIRYDKTGSNSHSKIPEVREGSSTCENIENIFIPKNGNFLEVPKAGTGLTKKKRPKTGRKFIPKITGDFTKAKILQNEPADKKVDFDASRKNSTLNSGRFGASRRSVLNAKSIHNSNLSRISKQNPALKSIAMKKGVRPQTAKNYYTQNIKKIQNNIKNLGVKNLLHKPLNSHQIKEAVIKYKNVDEQAQHVPGGSKTHSKSPFLSNPAISAFDQFNRDLLTHIPSTTLNPSSKPPRIRSAKRPKIQSSKAKIPRISSAKILKNDKSSKNMKNRMFL
ncbi:unnamed protein product [Moneuplotes crassus]|uniref:Uncharacterized protein n=1 Tax=Euplotes crassus TaxID=5936 RepID=A0AAD1YB96_EUPCR|nr:unnamed protein product [Moneuplotes crassus]